MFHSHIPLDSTSSRSTLNDECYELYRCDQITKSIQKSQTILIEHLEKLFDGVFPYAGWYIIGSTVNGFGQYRSDLDLCLMISHETLTELEVGVILQKIAEVFRRSEYFHNVKLIHQLFPKLSFYDTITSIECHLYLNEAMFIRHTYLMRFYAECDHRVPILVNIVKYWAMKVNLKSRTQHVLNGYCLSLMCIYYLQTTLFPCPIVPRFTEFLSEEKFHPNIDVRSLNLFDAIDSGKRWISTNVMVEVADLFLGFLRFYAIDFDFANDAISIRVGRKMNKRELIHPIDRNNRFVVIEEPLTGTNMTSAISTENLYQELLQIFRTNYHKILSDRQLL